MKDHDETQPGAATSRSDQYTPATLEQLLKYRGPRTRQEKLPESGVTIVDYRNSDENERTISILLSAEGIPFHIDRDRPGWSQSKLGMDVTVRGDHFEKAYALLSAAADASMIDRVEGANGRR